jgi:VCBS repeat-containing protein
MSTSLPHSGGTTASFTNAPQANGDTFAYLEDVLMANGLLYNQTTRILTLDVMANDLGGKAKSLFSIDDGFGNQLSDLATSDLLTNQSFSSWQLTANGNSIRIVNGKIEYRLSDGHGGVRDVNSMNAGEVLTDTFTYAIKLGNGTLSWARVSVSLTGSNDGATISGNASGNVVEAGGDDNALPGTPSVSGTLTVSDVDSGQATFAAPPLASLAGAYGTFAFNPTTGQWTFTLDNSRAATQSLAQGESAVQTLTVTSLDGTATRTITVTVTGTNDDPVITSGVQTGAVEEDTTLSASGQSITARAPPTAAMRPGPTAASRSPPRPGRGPTRSTMPDIRTSPRARAMTKSSPSPSPTTSARPPPSWSPSRSPGPTTIR